MLTHFRPYASRGTTWHMAHNVAQHWHYQEEEFTYINILYIFVNSIHHWTFEHYSETAQKTYHHKNTIPTVKHRGFGTVFLQPELRLSRMESWIAQNIPNLMSVRKMKRNFCGFNKGRLTQSLDLILIKNQAWRPGVTCRDMLSKFDGSIKFLQGRMGKYC